MQMLMHAIAHVGLYGHRTGVCTESRLRDKKSLAASIGDSNPGQYCICLSGRRPSTGAIAPIPYDGHASYSRVGSDFSLLPCDLVGESALKVGPWRKNPLPHRGLEPSSVSRLAFRPKPHSWSWPTVCTESRLWEKNPFVTSTGESNPRQYCAWLSFGRRPTTGSVPPSPCDSHVSYSRLALACRVRFRTAATIHQRRTIQRCEHGRHNPCK